MASLLYVVDEIFTQDLMQTHRKLHVEFGDYHLIAQPDVFGIQPSKQNGGDREKPQQIRWTDCLGQVAAAIREICPTRVVVAGHQGIFRDFLGLLESSRAEVRVPAAEKLLADHLGASVPRLSITGFHHVTDSEIHRILSKPLDLAYPGTFARIRALVEEGGGPAGRLSVLKHELMRPFTSVRLQLELDMENHHSSVHPRLVRRIREAVEDGRTRLENVGGTYEKTDTFLAAVASARNLLERQVEEITADPAALHGWIDQLNAALDEIRQEAR